jgi:signal transduction histidine kinase
MPDDVPVPGMQTSLIAQATREAGSMLYEILGMVELMRVAYEKRELESAQRRLEIILLEAGELSSMFSKIIEYSRRGSSPYETVSQNFNIVSLLQEVTNAARTLVKSKPVKVMDVAYANPVMINSQPDKIRLIMMGLMSNAAKFTDRGSIAMNLCREDDWIRLTVTDNGRGMSGEQIDSIFSSSDPEYNIELNSSLSCGMGLRIIQKMVKQLHGSISVSSKLGEGTIVEVRLPLEAQNNPSGS